MAGFDGILAGAQPPSREAASSTPATEQQQAEYQRFVGMGLMALTSEGFVPKAEKVLNSSPDVTDAMASIGASIVQRIMSAAMEQGTPIDPAVIVHGGLEIMGKVGEMAQAAGKQVTDEDVESAYYLAADRLNDFMSQSGMFDDAYAVEDEDAFMQQIGEEPVKRMRDRMGTAKQRIAQGLMGGQR